MSLDPSLKTAGNLASHRSVLTRAERVERMKANKAADFEKRPVLGLPKTGSRKTKR